MKQGIQGAITPQRKMIGVNDRFNNPGIKKQQGTTRTIYDSIPIDGRNEFRFFEEASTRQFPYTNMSSDGNKLGVGNSMIIERAYLAIVTVDGGTGNITQIQDIVTYGAPGIQLAELSLEIANSQVLKQVAVASMLPNFNKSAMHINAQNFEFDTQLALPPLLEFVFKVRTDAVPADNAFLRLTIEGTGALIAPRNTF